MTQNAVLRLTAESSANNNKHEVDSIQATHNEVLSFEGAPNNHMNGVYDDIRGSANWSEKESISSLNQHKRSKVTNEENYSSQRHDS